APRASANPGPDTRSPRTVCSYGPLPRSRCLRRPRASGRKDRAALPRRAPARYLVSMFQELRNAWREAVENFRRELYGEDQGTGGARDRLRAMQKDISVVRSELERIERELANARSQAAAERREEAVCRRREGLARGIGDEETAAIAARFAVRHAERAAVLERKAEALEAERDLLRRELAEMERIVSERAAEVDAGAAPD